MSRRDYLPDADAAFFEWCRNFAARVDAGYAAYGLGPSDAATLDAAFAAFSSARTAAANPSTRTIVAVTDKNGKRAALEALVRALVHRVQSFPGTDAPTRVALGIAPRRPRHDRIDPPATRPVLSLDPRPVGGVASVRLADEAHACRNALPPGVASAVLFTVARPAGVAPPTDLDDWRFEGIATKNRFPLPPRPADAGMRLHVKAAWTNPRGQLGPVSATFVTTVAA